MIDRKIHTYIYIYSKGVGKANDRQRDTYTYIYSKGVGKTNDR